MFLFKTNKLNRLIEALNEKYISIKNNDLDKKMDKLKAISESNEEYQELYITIKANYENLINNYYKDIEEKINNIKLTYLEMDPKIVKSEIKFISDYLDRAKEETNEIYKQISNMFELENKIRDELIPLKEEYRVIKDEAYGYKDSVKEFYSIFDGYNSKIEKNINDIEGYLTSGHYKKAKNILGEFKLALIEYKNHLENLPRLIDFTFNELPSRYEGVLKDYEMMKNEGYILFSIKMSNYQEEIENTFEKIKKSFYELRYDDCKDDIKNLTYEINKIRVQLDLEKESKDNFDTCNDKVYYEIDDVNKKFLKAKRDFYSVNGVYLVDKNKEDELIFIENELHALSRVKTELETYLHSPTKYPYSVLNQKLVELKDFCESINTKVSDFQSYIYSLKEDSQYAYKYVNDASIALTYYYNLLVSYNHKTLSSKYVDRYNDVMGYVDIISKELITKPIYVEKINDELKGFKVSATSLLNDMKNSAKLYNSASNIIVYTNKYRSSFSAVNDVLNRACIHFDNGEFEFAIDSVSEILQQVHPKAYEDMVKFKEENNE